MFKFKFNIQRFAENINLTEGSDNYTITGSDKIVYAKGGHDYLNIYYDNGNVTIYGGAGNDTFKAGGSSFHANNIMIIGNSGNDSIYNSGGNNWTISGDEDHDIIYSSYGNNVSINGGAGNDVITNNGGNNAILVGGEGDDRIRNDGDYGSIDGGAGNDSIIVEGKRSDNTIEGGAGNDTINLKPTRYDNVSAFINYASGDGNDYIYGFDENDTLKISGSYSTTSSGNNVIVNVGSGKITLDGAAGKSLNIVSNGVTVQPESEYIFNTNANSLVAGGSGADTIFNTGRNSTLNGNYGDDYIFNLASNISINGGAGNDTINATTGKITINGGYGNDEIILYGGSILYQYASGDGYDTVAGFGANDTLYITSGNISKSSVSGADVILTIDSGNITLKDAKGKNVKIKNSSGTLISTIFSGSSGEDTSSGGNSGRYITNTSNYTLISGTAYNDTIYNNNGDNSTIEAGAGDDSIYARDNDYVTVNAGAGNDTISGSYYGSKINGGAGNDLFSGYYYYDSNVIDGGDGYDTIYGVYAGSVNGGAGADRIILASGSSYTRTVNGGADNDTIYGDSLSSYGNVYQYASGDGYDYIYGYKSNDTISLAGSLNYQTLTSGSNVIVSLSSGSMTLYNASGKTLNIKGGTYSGNSNDIITNYTKNTYVYGTTNADSIYNYAGGVKIYASDGNDYIYNVTTSNYTINNSYGYATIDAGAGNDTVYTNAPNISISGGTGNNLISLSSDFTNNTIKAGAGNDTIYNFVSSYGYNVINAESAGLNAISIDYNDVILNFNGKSTRIKNAANQNIQFANSYTNGKINLQAGNTTLNINSTSKYYWAAGANATVSLGSSAPTSSNVNLNNGNFNDKNNFGFYGDIKAIDAGNFSGNATLTGNAKDNIIKGGYGYNIISGDKGNDTISLGGGSNLVNYNSGDGYDIIYGVKSSDTLQISGAKYSTTKSGSDLKVSVGNGEILLKNAANISFKINGTLDGGGNSNDNLPVGLSIKNSVLTASSSFSGNMIDLANYSKVTKVNASKLSQAISIVGTAAANSLKGGNGADKIYAGSGNDTVYGGNGYDIIYGGDGNDLLKGEAGNDTLSGGSGNDTLTGGAGNDLFIYSSGNDVITDCASGDMIQIDGTISSSYYSGKNIVFNVGSGSLTVKNAKGKYIFVTDSSGSNLYARTLDILYDNNFMTDDTNLDSITENKFAVTQIQTQDYSNLAQDEKTLIAYAEK